nr:hypothetical protein [Verrucomicrobium spinosum]
MFCQQRTSAFGLTRRDMLSRMGLGFGGLALADMLQQGQAGAAPSPSAVSEGGLPGLPHFAPKAKR